MVDAMGVVVPHRNQQT